MEYGYKPFENSEKNSDGVIQQRYEKAILLTSSSENDAKMKKTANQTTATDYSMFLNNCVDNVEATLKVGGFKTGSGNGMDPSDKFKDIKNLNKSYNVVSKELKPNRNEKQKN